MIKLRTLAITGILLNCFVPSLSGQNLPDQVMWFHPDQVVSIANLPSLTATSSNPTAVMAAALEIAVHDSTVCCKRDSALEDVMASEPRSLRELSAKLQERHRLSSGQTVTLNAEYVPESAINVYPLIAALMNGRPFLMEWKSHFYVLYGAVYNETRYYSGARQYAVTSLLLLDPRFSDKHRETVFNRETDQLSSVEGLLALDLTRK